MKMSILYEKLFKFKVENPDDCRCNKDVIDKLLIIGFHNQDEPGELPSVFDIERVRFRCVDQVEALMESIGYTVKAKRFDNDWNSTVASFRISLVEE